jgi:hypothetical protein
VIDTPGILLMSSVCVRFRYHAALPFAASGEMCHLRMPHLRIYRRHEVGAAMYSRGVLVHRPSRLAAAVAVLTVELPCGDGVFATYTLERGEPAHHFGRVMSHSFKCMRSSPVSLRTKVYGANAAHDIAVFFAGPGSPLPRVAA